MEIIGTFNYLHTFNVIEMQRCSGFILMQRNFILSIIFIVVCCASTKAQSMPTENVDIISIKKILSNGTILNPSLEFLLQLHTNPIDDFLDSLINMGFRKFDSYDSECTHLVLKYDDPKPEITKLYSFKEVYTREKAYQSILKCAGMTSIGWRTDVSLVPELEQELGIHNQIRDVSYAYTKYYYKEFNNIKYKISLLKNSYSGEEAITIQSEKK